MKGPRTAPGFVYGRLTVIRRAKPRSGRHYWLCRCECGRVREINSGNLRGGQCQSCGCLATERLIARNQTHGLSHHPEYEVWCSMKKRCYNPRFQQFSDYGGRGITICDQWRHNFGAFLADMGSRPSANHTIERIDNNGPYSPENCRWLQRFHQFSNTRRSRRLTLNGQTLTIAEWTRRLGFPNAVIVKRLKRGWPIERALTQPLRVR